MAFRCIENASTKETLQLAYDGVTIPDRHQLVQILHEQATLEMNQMMEEIRNQPSLVLAIDLWRANNNKNFLAVLAMYVRCR